MKNSILIPASLIVLALSACSNTKTPDTTIATPTTPNNTTTPVATPPVATPPVATIPSQPAPVARPANSLCNANEQVLFNCDMAAGGKTVSVCASNGLTNTSGSLQYRYGSDAYNVDMRFPQDSSAAQSLFSYDSQGLSFNNGSIKYQVYTQGSAGIKTFWAKAPSRNKVLPCAGTVTNQLQLLNGVLN
ncbi:MAG: hypothetical protein Q9M50_05985 [Methylococcales bacterium]|nr:hypothetical protein [Methylococcales bacterium]